MQRISAANQWKQLEEFQRDIERKNRRIDEVTLSIVENVLIASKESRSELLGLLERFDSDLSDDLVDFYSETLERRHRNEKCIRGLISETNARTQEVLSDELNLAASKGKPLACRTQDNSDEVVLENLREGKEYVGQSVCEIVEAKFSDRASIRFYGFDKGLPTMRVEVWGKGCVSNNYASFRIVQSSRAFITTDQLEKISMACSS